MGKDWRERRGGGARRGGRGREGGDIDVAREYLRRAKGRASEAGRLAAADARLPSDRAQLAGEVAADGYVLRRQRIAAAFRQGRYRCCSALGCRALAIAPESSCPLCRGVERSYG